MKTRIPRITVRFILVMILCILVNGVYAQHRHREYWELRSANFSVGYADNGFGFNNEIGISSGTSTQYLVLGLLSSPKPLKITGAKINYQYFLLPAEESTNIYLSILSEFNIGAALTDDLNVLMHEKDFKGEYEKYNSLDLGFGFGLKQSLLYNLSISASIYLDYYKRQIASSKDSRISDYSRYSSDSGIALNVKIGVSYEF